MVNAGPCKSDIDNLTTKVMSNGLLVVDAKLSFPSGLYVGWSGKRLGTLNLGTLQITADIGADINDESQFQILDVTLLTEFVKVWCFNLE